MILWYAEPDFEALLEGAANEMLCNTVDEANEQLSLAVQNQDFAAVVPLGSGLGLVPTRFGSSV